MCLPRRVGYRQHGKTDFPSADRGVRMHYKSPLILAALIAACNAPANTSQSNQSEQPPPEVQAAQLEDAPPQEQLQSALLHGSPWQAEILTGYVYPDAERKGRPQWDLAHRCGGSYVAPNWVLTAGHCFDNQPWKKYHWRIRLGARDLPEGQGVTFPIDRVVMHPAFAHIVYPSGKVHDSYVNDVALAHFVPDKRSRQEGADRGRSKHVAKIRLNGSRADDQAVKVGDYVAVSGWGRTDDSPDAHTNPHLDSITIRAVECSWSSDMVGKTDGGNLCAYGRKQDTCQGDSGGPMVRAKGEPVLVGIVSWGIGCAGPFPGVYVRIDRNHYFDWIDREVGGLPPTSKN